jgi:hypothetical protein
LCKVEEVVWANEEHVLHAKYFVLHDVDEEERLIHLCHHKEKLAITFGFINRPLSTTFHILKYYSQVWVNIATPPSSS